MKKLALIALIPLLAAGGGQSIVNTGNHRKLFTPACVAPTMTGGWTAYNAANTCTGGCSNGNAVTAVADLIASNNLLNTGTITYTTGSLNGLPSLSFPGTSYLGSVSSMLSSPSSMSAYFVGKVDLSQDNEIFGNDAGSGGPEWRINSSTGLLNFTSNFVTVIGLSTTGIPTNTYVAIAVTYVVSTGALNFYRCTGGTCSSIGSVTNAVGFSNQTNRMGTSRGSTDFKGNLVELRVYQNGILNTTTLGTYIQCQYGL